MVAVVTDADRRLFGVEARIGSIDSSGKRRGSAAGAISGSLQRQMDTAVLLAVTLLAVQRVSVQGADVSPGKYFSRSVYFWITLCLTGV